MATSSFYVHGPQDDRPITAKSMNCAVEWLVKVIGAELSEECMFASPRGQIHLVFDAELATRDANIRNVYALMDLTKAELEKKFKNFSFTLLEDKIYGLTSIAHDFHAYVSDNNMAATFINCEDELEIPTRVIPQDLLEYENL